MESLKLSNSEEFINRACSVIKPQLHSIIPRWLRSASAEEVRGLKVVESIIKHEGKKKFRSQGASTNLAMSRRSIDSYRTRYNEEYGQLKVKKHTSDLLKYRKLRELEISSVMRPESIKIIESWLQLEDCMEYQDYVLAFLRSVHSASRVYDKNQVSVNKSSFSWYNPEDFARSKSPQQPKSYRLNQPRASEPMPNSVSLPSIKKPLNLDMMKSYCDLPSAKKLKEVYMKGSGSFMSMGNSHSNATSYQEDFPAHTIEIKRPTKLDYHTSSAIKLLPDNNN
jgi:hypothetical protein